MVEQLTLNQRVAGSSPARLTISFNDLRQVANELLALPFSIVTNLCIGFGDTLTKRRSHHASLDRSRVSAGHQLILVNSTSIDDRVRIFSARKATRRERKDYEENVGS